MINHQEESKIFKKEEDLSSGIRLSFVLHTLLLSALTLKTIFFPPEAMEVMESVRVDIIDLPDKNPNLSHSTQKMIEKPNPSQPKTKEDQSSHSSEDLKPSPPNDKKMESEKEKDSLNFKQIKRKQQEAIKKLKTASAIDKIKQALDNETKESELKASQTNKIKGNDLAKGNSLTGLDRLRFDDFIDRLDQRVKDHFYLTGWLSGKKLKAILLVKINKEGQILERSILSSSGNSAYDDLTLEAIDKSAPFPSPPEKFVEHLAEVGFKIEFADSASP